MARTFPLPGEWGRVAAGEGFVAWSDELHLWFLPTGAPEPILLVEVSDTFANIQFQASGPWFYWHTDAIGDTPERGRLAHVVCP
jgi:hypothetical protein